ncbi:amphoterin-induced protein 1-like [Paramacrobiotus metropolitanus]|uniref:amphoterin-induced protein 1-like n=1 Tax=Paramacrobiotus metropolitanus TaxID=2943436 RepID=UPI002445EEEE|nr:amphoterin-induced protein 1-like [Paramacrobiotus metropolitanus]
MKHHWKYSVFFFFYTAILRPISSQLCPEKCTCQWINGYYTADCSQRNLTSIPADIPSNVIVLNLSGNQLRHIENATFTRNNLAHLLKLDLSYCHTATIDSLAFIGMSNLRELNLAGNQLQQLPSAIFTDIRNLRVLSLRHNHLQTIPNLAFNQLNQLETLDMQYSQIHHVDQEGLRGLDQLRSLQLNGNQLRRLTLATLAPLKSLQQLDLHNNPWDCNCHVRDVNAWMRQRRVGSGFLPMCHEPVEFRGRNWDQISIEKFACTPEILSLEAFNILPGQNISVECSVFGDPIPEIFWYFNDNPVNFSNTKYESYSQNITTHFIHMLIIRNASEEEDGGNYRCFATNWAGNTTGIMPLFQSSGILSATEATILLIVLLLIIFPIMILAIYYCKYKQHPPKLCSTLWKHTPGIPDKFRCVTYYKTSDAMLTPPSKPEESLLLLTRTEPNKETTINVIECQNPPSDAVVPPPYGGSNAYQISDTSEEDKDSGIQHEEENSSVRNDSSNGTPQDLFTDSDHESVSKSRTVTFSPNTSVYTNSMRRSPGPAKIAVNCLPGYDPYLGTEV